MRCWIKGYNGMKMIRWVGLLVLMTGSAWVHPVHVSVTNLDLDPVSGKVELSVKIFSDDFQDLILNKYGVQLNIIEQEEPGDKIGSVNQYIKEALQLVFNGKEAAELQFMDAELNEEAIWLFYRYDHPGKIRRVNIINRIMLEKFNDQTNLMIVTFNEKQNGYRLDNKTTDLSFNIKK
jgi:hypothetical protein